MMKRAFTGYRPTKLSWGENEQHPDCLKLKQRLHHEILRLTQEGITVFITGMAQAVDTWAAEEVHSIHPNELSRTNCLISKTARATQARAAVRFKYAP